MNQPRGDLVRSRVVSDPATALTAVLERELTEYAVFEPQDSLLLDADGHGIVTFEAGVPLFAYHTGTDRGGGLSRWRTVNPTARDSRFLRLPQFRKTELSSVRLGTKDGGTIRVASTTSDRPYSSGCF